MINIPRGSTLINPNKIPNHTRNSANLRTSAKPGYKKYEE